MTEEKKIQPAFTSAMTHREEIAALIYLPIHLFLLPMGMTALFLNGYIGETNANFLCYAIGLVYLVVFEWRFLRREFDPAYDNLLRFFSSVILCLALTLLCDIVMGNIMLSLGMGENPNNAALGEMLSRDYGKIVAMSKYMAPIVEELLFRAAIFGFLRRRNCVAAYVVSIALFSLYHIVPYAMVDSGAWLYLIQYIPASFLLCYCYERCNSIYGSITLHMLINSLALSVMQMP